MASISKELSDINTSFVTPTQGVVDNSVAQAISVFGEMGVDAVSGFKQAKFVSEAEELKGEFIGDDTLSSSELNEVTDFGKRMDKLGRLAKTSGRTDEFRVRAEALLKKHINKTPGLSQEFRQRASSALGFDPTGSEMQLKMQEIEEAQFDAERQLQQIDADAQSFGMIPGEVNTKEGQERYYTYTQLRRVQQEAKLLADTSKALGTDVKLDVPKQLFSMSPELNFNSRVDSNAVVNNTLAANGVPINVIKSGVNTDLLNQIGPEGRGILVKELELAKQKAFNQYIGTRSDFKNESEWRLFSEQIVNPYDEMISAVSGQKAIEDVKTDLDISVAAASSGFARDPRFLRSKIFSDNGLQLTPQLATDLTDSTLDLIGSVVPQKVGNFGATPTDPENIEGKDVSALGDSLRKAADRAYKVDGTDEQKDIVSGTLYNMAELFGDDFNYKKSTMDEFVKLLRTPASNDLLKNVTEDIPETRTLLTTALNKHAARLAVTASNRAESLAKDLRITKRPHRSQIARGETEVKVTEGIIPVIDEGVVMLQPAPGFEEEFKPSTVKGRRNRPDRIVESKSSKLLKGINNTILRDINDTVTAMVNARGGISREEALSHVLQGTMWENLISDSPE